MPSQANIDTDLYSLDQFKKCFGTHTANTLVDTAQQANGITPRIRRVTAMYLWTAYNAAQQTMSPGNALGAFLEPPEGYWCTDAP